MKILIKPEWLCPGVDQQSHIPFIRHGEVHIENQRIVYAGSTEGAPRFEADQTIEGRGKLLMPGLVNAHTHVPMAILRGVGGDLPLRQWLDDAIFPMERQLDDEMVRVGTQLSMLELLRFGTTSFFDMYMHMDAIVSVVKDTGIRAVLSYGVVDFDESCSDLPAGSDFYEKWHHACNDRIRSALAPHSEGATTKKLMQKLALAAKELDAIVNIHVSETREDHSATLVRQGCTQMQYLRDLGLLERPVNAAHCVWVTDEDIKLIKDYGVTVTHNPISNLKLASGIAPIKKMLDAGCHVALGTDGVASNNNLNLWEEMKLMPLLQRGTLLDPIAVSPAQTLHSATLEGARAMRYDDLGLLKSSYRADMILVDVDRAHMLPDREMEQNLIYAAQGSDVSMTMVDGKVLYQDGVYTTLDEQSILKKANQVYDRLREKKLRAEKVHEG